MNYNITVLLICMLFICFNAGLRYEKRHIKKIKERELKLYKMPLVSFGKDIIDENKVINSELISSSVVLGCDYFRMSVFRLINMFGGNISLLENVLERAKREAILRVKEEAKRKKYDEIINLKIETSMLSPIKKLQFNSVVTIIAYGTAIQYAD